MFCTFGRGSECLAALVQYMVCTQRTRHCIAVSVPNSKSTQQAIPVCPWALYKCCKGQEEIANTASSTRRKLRKPCPVSRVSEAPAGIASVS